MSELLTAPEVGIEPVADLVLVRYSLAKATPKQVRVDVGNLVKGEPLTETDFAEIVACLVSNGLLERKSRGSLVLTEAGSERVLRFLQTSALPPKLNWTTAISRFVVPVATGLSSESAAKLNDSSKLAVFVLKQKYGLAINTSSVNAALEAIVCRELGFTNQTTLSGLLEIVLSRLIGSEETLKKADLVKQIPLFQTGLKQVEAREIRAKLVRDWLADRKTTANAQDPDACYSVDFEKSEQSSAVPSQPQMSALADVPVGHPEPFDLATFASTVLALAASSPDEDRFFHNKVFIAPIWRASQREYGFPKLTLVEFKQRLIEAFTQELLQLSRADFVQAMEAGQVAESETTHLNATFHFVLLPETNS